MNKKLSFFKHSTLQLFLISFFILYLELIAIRFIPSQIRYVGYFSNIILLASFTGIGIGTLFWKKIRLPDFLIPILIFLFEFTIGILRYDLFVSSDQVIYFNAGYREVTSEPIFLLPLIFFITVLVFIPPSAMLGGLLKKLSPLKAYAINIAGSIAGIIFFTLTSALGLGPAFWFTSLIVISLILMKKPKKRRWPIIYAILILVSLSLEIVGSRLPGYLLSNVKFARIHWSPYHKVSMYQELDKQGKPQEGIFRLSVNNIGHQTLLNQKLINTIDFYQYPYLVFPERTFEKVLVIGAGTGNDVAMALEKGAKKVVAVEIDPVITKLGKQYHPEKPYSSENVEIIIDDGRSYLVKSQEKFDLVIFALTDSLTLTSPAANLRLESYLFTREAFVDARNHLEKDGLFVLYNYYRNEWLIDKLALLLNDSFSRMPYVKPLTTQLGPAAVLIGAREATQLPESEYIPIASKIDLPTDDWPFLYLKNRSLPSFYLQYIGIITLVTGLFLISAIKKTKTQFNWPLFYMGAAFMLLETKNVVEFSLLFGSTWITNALVFTGILSLVLLAVLLASRMKSVKLNNLYIILFLLIALSFFFPQRELLKLSFLSRLLSAIVINFSPIFVANIIFAMLFKRSKLTPLAYGSNIVGAFAGGMLEYSSMIWGYRNLTLLVALFYAMSLLSARKYFKR